MNYLVDARVFVSEQLSLCKEAFRDMYLEDDLADKSGGYGYLTCESKGRAICVVDLGLQVGKMTWKTGEKAVFIITEIARPILGLIGAFFCLLASLCGDKELWDERRDKCLAFANPCAKPFAAPDFVKVILKGSLAIGGNFLGIFFPEVGRQARLFFDPALTFDANEDSDTLGELDTTDASAQPAAKPAVDAVDADLSGRSLDPDPAAL